MEASRPLGPSHDVPISLPSGHRTVMGFQAFAKDGKVGVSVVGPLGTWTATIQEAARMSAELAEAVADGLDALP